EDERTLQLSAGVNTALVISAVMVLFIGIFAGPFIQWATESVQMVSMRGF
ncbi:MAG: hypothetical protein GXP38_17425, partial [Chloroflexi bacterium]|nr:hypothetical protein [Chloroflexota bacterium]